MLVYRLSVKRCFGEKEGCVGFRIGNEYMFLI